MSSTPRRILFGGSDPEFLQCAAEQIAGLVADRVNLAAAQKRLKEHLRAHGYQPSDGDLDTLNDFSGDERLALVLQTNFWLERGYRRWIKNQDALVLQRWPAQEVVSFSHKESHEDQWALAGGMLFKGRMIALMNDPVWENLSPFGLPYEPFALDGTLRARGVLRQDWARLNPPQADLTPQPQDRRFIQDLEQAAARCEDLLRELLPSAEQGDPLDLSRSADASFSSADLRPVTSSEGTMNQP